MLRVNHLAGFGKNRPSSGSSYDTDAQAFFTAAGITDTTQKDAVNQLVLDLKSASLWTKMKAIYPFVGGTSTTHKYNLKDPRDLDAAYRIVWSGTVTHDSNGITGNGTTGYGNTKLASSSALSNNNTHLSVYVRTSTTETASKVEIGGSADATHNFTLAMRQDGYFISNMYIPGSGWILVDTGNAQGFGISSRTSSTVLKGYRNGSLLDTATASNTGGLNDYEVYIGAENSAGSAARYSNRNIAFASIGTGLTDTDASNFYTAVETYQDALSRGVV